MPRSISEPDRLHTREQRLNARGFFHDLDDDGPLLRDGPRVFFEHSSVRTHPMDAGQHRGAADALAVGRLYDPLVQR